MDVREAVPEDAHEMVAIWLQAWPQRPEAVAGMVAMWGMRIEQRMWLALVAVAEDGRIAGFARADFPTKRRPVGDVVADVVVEYLVVHEDSRGNGVGRRLDQELRDRLVGRGEIAALDVESHNSEAFAFWTACGWTYCAEEKNQGQGGGSRYVFTHDLRP